MITVGLLMTLNRIAHERVGGGKEGESHSVCRQLQTRTEASRGSFLLDIHKIWNFLTLIYRPIKSFHLALQAINWEFTIHYD